MTVSLITPPVDAHFVRQTANQARMMMPNYKWGASALMISAVAASFFNAFAYVFVGALESLQGAITGRSVRDPMINRLSDSGHSLAFVPAGLYAAVALFFKPDVLQTSCDFPQPEIRERVVERPVPVAVPTGISVATAAMFEDLQSRLIQEAADNEQVRSLYNNAITRIHTLEAQLAVVPPPADPGLLNAMRVARDALQAQVTALRAWWDNLSDQTRNAVLRNGVNPRPPFAT